MNASDAADVQKLILAVFAKHPGQESTVAAALVRKGVATKAVAKEFHYAALMRRSRPLIIKRLVAAFEESGTRAGELAVQLMKDGIVTKDEARELLKQALMIWAMSGGTP